MGATQELSAAKWTPLRPPLSSPSESRVAALGQRGAMGQRRRQSSRRIGSVGVCKPRIAKQRGPGTSRVEIELTPPWEASCGWFSDHNHVGFVTGKNRGHLSKLRRIQVWEDGPQTFWFQFDNVSEKLASVVCIFLFFAPWGCLPS